MKKFFDRFLSFSIGEGKKTKRTLLVCILLATVIWTLNALNKDYTTTLKYPVKYNYNHKQYIPAEELNQYVILEVNGFGWNLLYRSIWQNADPVEFEIDSAGSRTVPANKLKKLINQKFNEIEINKVLYDTLHIRFDALLSKKCSFYLMRNNEDSLSGYKKKFKQQATFHPAHITCKGPASKIKALPDSIPVRIKAADLNDNYSAKIPVSDIRQLNMLQCEKEHIKISLQQAKDSLQ